MPTVLIVDGFRFFFYSNENNEPVHIHVEKDGGSGKIWLEPEIAVAWFYGFTNKEEKEISGIIKEHAEAFKNKWYEYFGK
jgi:hypothetical protein